MGSVVVVGGGASGMMAAIGASESGNRVTLLEKNEKLGKKIYITGKGRCNLTNASDVENHLSNIVSNKKFLYSALYGFDSYACMDFFEEMGLKLKTERGNRVFPLSDKSSDVIKTLEKALRERNVFIQKNTEVKDIIISKCDADGYKKRVTGVVAKNVIEADNVIIATGGLSYPSTGSTGDGYIFAKKAGHDIISCRPSLVPLVTEESFVPQLQGLSLKNVRFKAYNGEKKIYDEMGEMLFTHFGISGPLVLSLSSIISGTRDGEVKIYIDLKPALDFTALDGRILRDFDEMKNVIYKNSLKKLLPAKLIPVVIKLSGIKPEKRVNEITKEERHRLVNLIKRFELTVTGLRDFSEAVITSGGVSVKDVNPATLESKKCRGLYFVGEVLDLDAMTGGYNLQIAWSTGMLAGRSVR